MESLVKNFKSYRMIRSNTISFSDQKKYQRERENDSREPLVENFKTGKMTTFFFSDQKKYQREMENDSRDLQSAAGIGVVLAKDAQQGGKVLKQMHHFKLKKEPKLNLDSNLILERKQEKFVEMHHATMEKFLFLNIRITKELKARRWPTTWYCIDLSKIKREGDKWVAGKMDLKFKMPENCPCPIMCVALGSVIYVFGETSSITRMYYLDTSNPKNEWLEGPSMNLDREIGSAVVHDGKIYIVGGFVNYKYFGEVYDPVLNRWEPMSKSPEEAGQWQVSFGGIYSKRKILVHFFTNGTLYAYDVEDKSWDELDKDFGCWHCHGVIMDDILYVFDCFNAEIRGYDLVLLKWLKPINLICLEWFSETTNFKEELLDYALFFKVGAKVLCLVYGDRRRGEGLVIYCKTFTIEKTTPKDGDDVLKAQVFSSTIYNLGEEGSCLNYVVT